MSTGLATWTEPAEDESLSILPILIAIVVGVGIAGMTMLRRASDAIVETEEEDPEYSKDEY